MKITVNGQSVYVNGGQNVSISQNGDEIVITTGEAVKKPEPFRENVSPGVTEKIEQMNAEVNSSVVEGHLKVKGMGADIVVQNLIGKLTVDGMNPTVSILYAGPSSTLRVDGMNADVHITTADRGAEVRVRGMNAVVTVPECLAVTAKVTGMNSYLDFL